MFNMISLVGTTLLCSSVNSKSTGSGCVSKKYRHNNMLDILVFVLLMVQAIGYQPSKIELSSNDRIRQIQKQETPMNESSFQQSSYICDFIDDSGTIVFNSMNLVSIRHVVSEIDQQIRFEIIYNGIGYIGFALSNTSTMIPNLAIIGLPDNNTVLKYSLNGKTVDEVIELPTDEQTSIRNVSILQSIQNQKTILDFTRPLQQTDNNNNEINFDNTGQQTINQFIWAVGITNNLGTHLMSGHHIIESIHFCNGTIIPSLTSYTSIAPTQMPQPVPVLVPSPVTTTITTTPTVIRPAIPVPVPIPIPISVPVTMSSPTVATVPTVPKVVPVKVPVVTPSPIVVIPSTVITPMNIVPIVVVPSIPTVPTIPTVVVTTVNGTTSPAVAANTTYQPTIQQTTKTNVSLPTTSTTITTMAPSEYIDNVTISVPTQTPSANLIISPVTSLPTTQQYNCSIQNNNEPYIVKNSNNQLSVRHIIHPIYKTITMEIIYNGLGYIAFGFSNTGRMVPSIVYIGLPDNTYNDAINNKANNNSNTTTTPTTAVNVYSINGKSINNITRITLKNDTISLLTNTSLVQNDTHTIMKLTRDFEYNNIESFLVSDSSLSELSFVNLSMNESNMFIWSVGNNNTLSKHTMSGNDTITFTNYCTEILNDNNTTTINSTIHSSISVDTTKRVSINLPDNLQVTMIPSIDTRYVSVVMTHLHNDIDKSGYLALAVSSTGTMIGSTAIVGSTDNEFPMKYTLMDKSLAKVIKVQENRQTLLNASYIRNSTHTILQFYKLVIEDNEIPIKLIDGNTTFIYAIGVQSQLAYHGTSGRGVFTCSLSSAACTIVDIRLDTVIGSKHSARLAHSIVMILAWVVLVPSAVGIKIFRQLLLRFPVGQRFWDIIHFSFIYVGTVLTIIGFFIAVGTTQQENKTHFNRNSHTKVGIVLFILTIIKVLFISFSVFKKRATATIESLSAAATGAAVPGVSPTNSLQSKQNDIEPEKTSDTDDDGCEEEKKEEDEEDVISVTIIPKASTERSDKYDSISDDEDVYVHDDIEDPPGINENAKQQQVVNDVTPAIQTEKDVVFQKTFPSEVPLSHQQQQQQQQQQAHQKVENGTEIIDDNNVSYQKGTNSDKKQQQLQDNQKVETGIETNGDTNDDNQIVTSDNERDDDINNDTISDNDSTTIVTTTIVKSTNSILSTREVLYRIQWFVLIGISWYACHTGSILFNEQYNGSINYTTVLWSVIGCIMTMFLFILWYIN